MGSGKELLAAPLRDHSQKVISVAFSPDGRQLATAAEGEEIAKVWSADSGKELLTLGDEAHHVTSVAFSPDGKRIATTSKDETTKVWDGESGRELLTPPVVIQV